MTTPLHAELPQAKAPLFRSWTIWYVVVIGWLIALVLFFFFITNYFA